VNAGPAPSAGGEPPTTPAARDLILERTRNGDEILEFLIGVLRGARFRWPELHPRELPGVAIRPTARQRALAAACLAERAWGTAPRGAPFRGAESTEAEAGGDALSVTPEELDFLEAVRSLAIERDEAAGAGGALDRYVPAPPDAGPSQA
jgi:hypothetical protein